LDVIQLKCLARASVRLDFTKSDGAVGRIYLSDEEVVHAEVISPTGAGSKEGSDAFNEALSWRGGTVVEEPRAGAPDYDPGDLAESNPRRLSNHGRIDRHEQHVVGVAALGFREFQIAKPAARTLTCRHVGDLEAHIDVHFLTFVPTSG
jgi:hypothetical protein